MKKQDFVNKILAYHPGRPMQEIAFAYAPSNIALCKYWGKRDEELNLPETSSLSVSLADRGATTLIKLIDSNQDEIVFGEHSLSAASQFAKRVSHFLDLFRPKGQGFFIKTDTNIPIAAGLASSAAGFAALISALNLLFGWQLNNKELSLLARLGSGSACRSLWHGFVEWHCGQAQDGLDSYAEPLNEQWPELRVGLLITHTQQKPISSREAMKLSKTTSLYYKLWPEQVAKDLPILKQAIMTKDFKTFGEVAESNALAMHATMLTAKPAVLYWQPETLQAMYAIWQLRAEGIPVYFTEDAGPNIKLLFLAEQADRMQAHFRSLEIVAPWHFTEKLNN